MPTLDSNEELGKILTRLENAVERSTMARINGRTMNNRMLHAQAITELSDLILADREAAIREARIDELDKYMEKRRLADTENEALEYMRNRVASLNQPTKEETK